MARSVTPLCPGCCGAAVDPPCWLCDGTGEIPSITAVCVSGDPSPSAPRSEFPILDEFTFTDEP